MLSACAAAAAAAVFLPCCSVGQRIKEALPGTKEHKAKKESEDNLAVYS
jgi:hypothetical protein